MHFYEGRGRLCDECGDPPRDHPQRYAPALVMQSRTTPGYLAAWRGLHRGAEEWHPEVRRKQTTLKELRRKERALEARMRGWMREQAAWLQTFLDVLVLEPETVDDLDFEQWEQRFAQTIAPPFSRIVELGGDDSKIELRDPRGPSGTALAAEPAIDVAWTVESVEAQRYITNHGLELAKGLNDTTRKRIKQALVRGQRLGLPMPEIGKLVNAQYRDMSTWRARLIAQTETIRGYAQGGLQVYKDAARTARTRIRKQWLDGQAGADQICRDLDGEVVDLDEAFSSGDDTPPAHPGCRCAQRARIG